MTKIDLTQLTLIYDRLRTAALDHKINESFTQLEALAAQGAAEWSVRERISDLKERYRLLCDYALDNVNDPERTGLYDGIVAAIMSEADKIMRRVVAVDSPKLYFARMRYEAMQTDSDLTALLDRYTAMKRDTVSSFFTGKASAEGDSRKVEMEQLAARIFNLTWITFPLPQDAMERLREMFADVTIDDNFKQYIISALLLGGLEYYDENRLMLLVEIYNSGAERIESIALTALLILLWMHRDMRPSLRITNAISALEDRKGWGDDIIMTWIQLARTDDTEQITRTMNEEIIPRMMKLRPDIYRRVSESEITFEDAMAENPDWEEMLDQAGITDKLRKLNDMQAEGADVMLGTFAHLKTHPFFNEMPNWFLPFDPNHSSVAPIVAANRFIETLVNMPVLCDSDKYSLLFSISGIPESGRRMITEQLGEHSAQLAEIESTVLDADSRHRENYVNRYIQSLYRFFRLFRRKSEFRDPFATPINLASLPLLESTFADSSTLRAIAQHYYSHKHFRQALAIYRRLETGTDPGEEVYQRLGYCYQMIHDYDKAIQAYVKAEYINSDSAWTMRRLATCYKMTGDNRRALDYYTRLATESPDDLNIAMSVGHCNLELGNYDEALRAYFKVEYLDTKNRRALRPIAWTLFLKGDMERSREYYDRILALDPTGVDYLNMGHLAMARHEYRHAIELYRKALRSEGYTPERLMADMATDRRHLTRHGVDPLMIDIVADHIVTP